MVRPEVRVDETSYNINDLEESEAVLQREQDIKKEKNVLGQKFGGKM